MFNLIILKKYHPGKRIHFNDENIEYTQQTLILWCANFQGNRPESRQLSTDKTQNFQAQVTNFTGPSQKTMFFVRQVNNFCETSQ